MANYWTIVEDRLLYQDPPVEDVDAKAAELRKQLTPEVVMMVKDNCIDKQQQAALAAKRSEKIESCNSGWRNRAWRNYVVVPATADPLKTTITGSF